MQPRSPRLALALLLAAPACSDPAGTSKAADDTAAATPPCDGGGWGAIADPDAAVHTSPDGSDAADGSAAAPLATLDAALALARADGRPIAVWPGAYTANLSLEAAPADGGTDDGLVLAGCSADEVSLAPADPAAPTLLVTEATGVRVTGLAFEGGRRALLLWSGAEVSVESVRVRAPEVLGIAIDGSDTLVDLVDTEVTDVVDEDGVGYGIQLTDGELRMTGGLVRGAVGAGIVVHGGLFTIDGASVEDTAATSDGVFGRGLQVQAQAEGTVRAATFSGNVDAAVFVSGSPDLTVEGLTITGTAAGAEPTSGASTGDGIVVTQGGENVDPAWFVTMVRDNVVTGSARAGIVLEGVSATVDGNDTTGNGSSATDGTSLYAQGGSVVSGADGVTTLPDEAAFGLNLEALRTADLAE